MAIADFLMLRILRESGGTAVTVDDEEMKSAIKRIGASEGIFCAPEGAACLPALEKLRREGLIQPEDRIILFNTGAGLKYPLVE